MLTSHAEVAEERQGARKPKICMTDVHNRRERIRTVQMRSASHVISPKHYVDKKKCASTLASKGLSNENVFTPRNPLSTGEDQGVSAL